MHVCVSIPIVVEDYFGMAMRTCSRRANCRQTSRASSSPSAAMAFSYTGRVCVTP
jgi:hypothetical protein